jgi:hypothetical protein
MAVREIVDLVLWDESRGAFNLELLPRSAVAGLRDMCAVIVELLRHAVCAFANVLLLLHLNADYQFSVTRGQGTRARGGLRYFRFMRRLLFQLRALSPSPDLPPQCSTSHFGATRDMCR